MRLLCLYILRPNRSSLHQLKRPSKLKKNIGRQLTIEAKKQQNRKEKNGIHFVIYSLYSFMNWCSVHFVCVCVSGMVCEILFLDFHFIPPFLSFHSNVVFYMYIFIIYILHFVVFFISSYSS